MTEPPWIEVGQEWEHVAPCQVCGSDERPVRHRYRVVVDPGPSISVRVRELSQRDGRAVGAQLLLRRSRFGAPIGESGALRRVG